MEGEGGEPGWWEDVGAALAFEEEGEPEGKKGSIGRIERGKRTLGETGSRNVCDGLEDN